MLSPLLLFERKRENVFILIFLTIILCISGQNINDIPLSGFVILLGVLLYFFKNKIFVITMLTSLGLGIFFFWQKLPQDFFASSGRLNWWAEYYKYFHALPVTGNGLGIVNIVCKLTPFTELRHLHNEPYQILVELGIIGFVLIIWLVHDFFKRVAEDRLELTLKALILGFLVSCCFQYTAHLWLPTILTTFFYASFIVLKEKNYDC
jgi:O-antigen ligase